MGRMKEATQKAPATKQAAQAAAEVKKMEYGAAHTPVVPPQGGPLATVSNIWTQYGDSASNRPLGTFLKFSKGDYLAGADSREIKIGTRMVVNMNSLRLGWQRWDNNRPTQRGGLLIDGYQPALRSELGDLDEGLWEVDKESGEVRDPWQFFNSIMMTDVKGKELYNFSTTSRGGIGAIGELCKIFGRFERLNPGKLPIISLGSDSYPHKNRTYGRIKFPVFQLAGWADQTLFDAAQAKAIEAAEAIAEDNEDDGDEGEDALM